MFYHYYLPEDPASEKVKLYGGEREVFEALKRELSARHLPDLMQKLAEKAFSYCEKKKCHPLHYPLLRHVLHPKEAYFNLHYVLNPAFPKALQAHFGNDKLASFFRERKGEPPYQSYLSWHALLAVWRCALFLKRLGASVTEFHVAGGEGQGPDVAFEWKGKTWHAQVKHKLDEDASLWFIADVIAATMWLEDRGRALRERRVIKVYGPHIDDTLRAAAANCIHDHADRLLRKLNDMADKGERKYEEEVAGLHIELLCRCEAPSWPWQLQIRTDDEVERKMTLHFYPNDRNRASECYTICPSQASVCPAPLSEQIDRKLDEKLTDLRKQVPSTGKCLGYLWLDLHDEHCDDHTPEHLPKEAVSKIREKLDGESFPIVLDYYPPRTSTTFSLANHLAAKAGFVPATRR